MRVRNFFPQIVDYDAAVARVQASPPVRQPQPYLRDLRNLRGDHPKHRYDSVMTIRMEDDDVIARFYSTDVMVWHPNGDITVTPYPSQSTEAFMSLVLPRWTTVSWCTQAGYAVETANAAGWRAWRRVSGGPTRLIRGRALTNAWGGTPTAYQHTPEKALPFHRTTLDKADAKRIMADYPEVAEFSRWVKAREALVPRDGARRGYMSTTRALEHLRNGEFRLVDEAVSPTQLRLAVLKQQRVATHKVEVWEACSYGELRSLGASGRRYGA